jgi:hypothetical protein
MLGYIPPPFYYRFFISLLNLMPVAVIMTLSCYKYCLARNDNVYSQGKRHLFYLIIFFVVISGAFFAARDALNDEGWNPAMSGTLLLALIWPTAYYMFSRKQATLMRFMWSFLAYYPSFIFAFFLTNLWQYVGREMGLPTSW